MQGQLHAEGFLNRPFRCLTFFIAVHLFLNLINGLPSNTITYYEPIETL